MEIEIKNLKEQLANQNVSRRFEVPERSRSHYFSKCLCAGMPPPSSSTRNAVFAAVISALN